MPVISKDLLDALSYRREMQEESVLQFNIRIYHEVSHLGSEDGCASSSQYAIYPWLRTRSQ